MATSLTARIASDLRNRISAGQLRPGDRLPSEADLMDQHSVSRITVRRAVALLVNEGLVVSRHGSGTYVRARAMLTYHAARAERHDGRGETDAYVAEVKEALREPSQDFSMRIEPVSEAVAAELHLREGDMVVVRGCFRYVDRQPWSDQVSYYPMDAPRGRARRTHDIPRAPSSDGPRWPR